MPSADACAGLCWPGSGFVRSGPCVRPLRRRSNSNAAPASASPPGRAIERYDLVRLRLADPWAAAASWGMTVCPTLGTSWLGEDPGEDGGVRTKLGRRPRTQGAARPWESRSRDAGGRERRGPRRRRLGDDAERVLLVAVAATLGGRAATVALSNAAAHQRREPLANAYGSLRFVTTLEMFFRRNGPCATSRSPPHWTRRSTRASPPPPAAHCLRRPRHRGLSATGPVRGLRGRPRPDLDPRCPDRPGHPPEQPRFRHRLTDAPDDTGRRCDDARHLARGTRLASGGNLVRPLPGHRLPTPVPGDRVRLRTDVLAPSGPMAEGRRPRVPAAVRMGADPVYRRKTQCGNARGGR